MYVYSTAWLMFVLGNARADHYNRGFNGLTAFPEMLVFGVVGSAVIALTITLVIRLVQPRLIAHRAVQVVWLLSSINLLVVLWLGVLSLSRSHGLWVEHIWRYDHVLYRTYAFTTVVTWSTALLVMSAWGVHHLAIRARAWRALWLGHVPLVIMYVLLTAHRWISKPVFMG
ncbi:MAG: hypothetical protein AAF267_07295 [Deinococcota bacterium]